MKELLRDGRVRRLLVANTLGSIGSGITIFSVPWLLVHREGGNEAFRWATVGTTLALFLLTPYYGSWVDHHSRKTALLGSELWGLVATTAMALSGFWLGGFGNTQLMLIYLFGMLYYALHYPAKFAFIQQTFDRSHYQSLTGLLEIQGQAAMMIAGGLGGILVEHVPLTTILLLDAATYLASFLIQSSIPYEATHLRPAAAGSPSTSVWGNIGAGWHWLHARPRLALFFAGTLAPFLVVMAGNYLFPIYVAQSLQAGAGYFAGGEITFALGAILAGAWLPQLISRHSAAQTIPATMLVCLAGIALLYLFQLPLVYLLAGALIGFGNAGNRVARSSLLMHLVPNEVMGRVGGFYHVLDRILRTLLVLSLGIIDQHGPPAGFLLLGIFLAAALIVVWLTRTAAEPTART
jgi:MFS family permease